MPGTVKFLIIGLGHIGRRHAGLAQAHPEGVVAGIVDLRPKADLGLPDPTYQSAVFYPDLALALTEPDRFDVACVCTPNGLHAEQAIRCMRAGLDVVIEKPLATSTVDAERIATVAGRTGRRVFGVMQNRYSPASAWLKTQLDNRVLGTVLQVHLDCFWNRDHRYYTLPAPHPPHVPDEPAASGIATRLLHPWHGDERLDGGVLFTQFAHFIDLLCWAFGAPEIQAARFANQQHRNIHRFADTGMVHFTLPGTALGSLNFSTAVWGRNFESTLTVIGAKGTIKLGGQYMNEVRYCHVDGLSFPELPTSAPGNDYGGYTGSAANHHFVIDNVVDVLQERGQIATPVDEGVTVVKTIEAMYAAGNPKQPTA